MIVKTSGIQPHPKNSEIYDLSNIEDLVKSIEEVGLLQPLIINKKNQILSGHRRYQAIKILGWDEVEVEVRDIIDEETDLYLVHYNKQRIKSNKEVLSEHDILEKYYEDRQGMRTDLTSVPRNKSYRKRDEIATQIGVSSSSLGKLLFIRKNNPNHIELIDKGVLTIRQSYTQTQREVNENVSREKRDRLELKFTNGDFIKNLLIT